MENFKFFSALVIIVEIIVVESRNPMFDASKRISDEDTDEDLFESNEWRIKDAKLQNYLRALTALRLQEMNKQTELDDMISPPYFRHRPHKEPPYPFIPGSPSELHYAFSPPQLPSHLQYPKLEEDNINLVPNFGSNINVRPINRLTQGNSDDFAVPPSDPRFYQNREISTDHNKILPHDVSKMTDSGTDKLSELFNKGNEKSEDVYSTPLEFSRDQEAELLFHSLIIGSSIAVIALTIGMAIYWYRLCNDTKNAEDADYPAYGVTGPNKDTTPTGDRRLDHSAQIYHYQLTKQQIIAMESNRGEGERRGSVSDGEEDSDDGDEGDYTVYECPGLAPVTGEMEVKNPLFQEETTPSIEANQQKSKQKQQEKEPKVNSDKIDIK